MQSQEDDHSRKLKIKIKVGSMWLRNRVIQSILSTGFAKEARSVTGHRSVLSPFD